MKKLPCLPLAVIAMLAFTPSASLSAASPDAFSRVRAHDFHPVRDGFTYDRNLDRHGIADPDDNDWLVRTLAVRDLVRANDPPTLLEALQDANPHVRQVSAMAVGILRVREAVRPLVTLLSQDPEPFVRAQVAVALAQIGDASALPAIETARVQDPQRDVKHQAELAAHALRTGQSATPELARAHANLDPANFDQIRVGEPAPDFILTDTDGQPWRLSDHLGQSAVALIWIFADWCPVCHREFHDLIDLREQFASAGLTVATLECHDVYPARVMVGKELEPSTWFSKNPFQEEYTQKVWWPHLVDRAATVGTTFGVRPMAYAVHAEFINQPAVVIIDRAGILRFAYYGNFWGDRPSISEILGMVEEENYEFVHPRRLPAPSAGR